MHAEANGDVVPLRECVSCRYNESRGDEHELDLTSRDEEPSHSKSLL